MTDVWGIDLGVRAFAAARLHDSLDDEAEPRLEVFEHVIKHKLKISDLDPKVRARDLASLGHTLLQTIRAGDHVFIEEPPLAGRRNIRVFGQLNQTAGVIAAFAAYACAHVQFVPVDSWKQGTVGRGGADKASVSRWLSENYESYSRQCGGDQNRVDATCIALFGAGLLTRGAEPGGLDQPREALAAG